jgi:hypothetical protein
VLNLVSRLGYRVLTLPNPSEKIETEWRLSFAARIPETVWALGVVSLLNSWGRRGDAASAPDELKQNAVAMMDDELVECSSRRATRPQSCRPNRP